MIMLKNICLILRVALSSAIAVVFGYIAFADGPPFQHVISTLLCLFFIAITGVLSGKFGIYFERN